MWVITIVEGKVERTLDIKFRTRFEANLYAQTVGIEGYRAHLDVLSQEKKDRK